MMSLLVWAGTKRILLAVKKCFKSSSCFFSHSFFLLPMWPFHSLLLSSLGLVKLAFNSNNKH